jgi:hypothetical protein
MHFSCVWKPVAGMAEIVRLPARIGNASGGGRGRRAAGHSAGRSFAASASGGMMLDACM